MKPTLQSHKNVYYPPGGILIWGIIILEIITFSIALIIFAYQRQTDLDTFISSQNMLNKTLGTLNTIVLITSGFFMALTVHFLKKGNNKKSSKWILLSMLLGVVFLVLKGYEYSDKLEQGLTIEHNHFFIYYWLLTGFHFIHVFVGLIILSFLYFGIKKNSYNKTNLFDVETGAAFWHMCDLIWLFLFPVLYLLH